MVKITNIQVDISFIIPKLIGGVLSRAKELNGLSDLVLSTRKSSHACAGREHGEDRAVIIPQP